MVLELSAGGDGAIPLLDGNGSTIAMVANATGSVASTYTYDPFGKVTIGGSGYETAYQYLGMEKDMQDNATWAYYGGGACGNRVRSGRWRTDVRGCSDGQVAARDPAGYLLESAAKASVLRWICA